MTNVPQPHAQKVILEKQVKAVQKALNSEAISKAKVTQKCRQQITGATWLGRRKSSNWIAGNNLSHFITLFI